MHISYVRSGGFMGRKVNLELSLDDLPADQAETFHLLLKKSDFFSLPESLPKAFVPDEFIYTITVITQTQEHTVHISDTTMPEELHPLIEELSQYARMQ